MQCDASTQVGDKNLAQLRELNAMFTRLDKDGDGTVDAEEARTGVAFACFHYIICVHITKNTSGKSAHHYISAHH